MKQKLIVIAGPTASGKTACAVALARRLGGEVISADSMQIYRGMELLSAAPTPEEQGGIPHHLLGVADPSQRFTASMFREKAACAVREIAGRGNAPIVCGGTGLYIDALTRPMSFSVQADPALHEALMARADEPGGPGALHEELEEVDPEAAARLHVNDVRRVVRALEIYRLTGIPQSEHMRRDAARPGDYDERIYALDWPREALYRRIDLRVDDMVARGLVETVRKLHDQRERFPTAEQAIGYKEIVDHLEGFSTLDEAVARVKQATRNFAKRQLTWFRRDKRTQWIKAEGKTAEAIAEEIIGRLND